MPLLASNLIAALRVTSLDPSPGDVWTDADWLLFLAAAEREVCLAKPDTYVISAAVSLVAGTKQTLPAGATGVLDVYENTVSGRRCTLVERSLMDEAARFFPAATREVDAQHWIADTRDPTRFDVVPPNDGTGSLQCLYGITPANFTAASNPIHLPDLYEAPIKFFALAEAYAANTKRQDFTKSGIYRGEALKMLGIRSQSQAAIAPRARR